MKSQPEAAHAGRVVDRAEVARELCAARTVLREPDLRVVVIAIAEPHASDTAMVQVPYGRVRVRLAELGADHLLPIERGLAHELAVDASAFVLDRSAA